LTTEHVPPSDAGSQRVGTAGGPFTVVLVNTYGMAPPDAQAADRSERSSEAGDGEAIAPDRPSLTRSDERLLSYLADVGADYQAFIAGNTGLYDDHVESRLTALADAGLVERVSGEAVYRVTDAGREALREDCPRWSD
jgi:DNA-binding MarR family transcriptional regulator